MFDDLRHRLRVLAGRRTAYAPPAPAEPKTAARIRSGLERLWTGSPERYARFFLFGKPLLVSRRERPLFEALARAGLASRVAGSLFTPHARVFPLEGMLAATDLLSHAGEDQVFSLMFEQVYLLRNMDVRPGDRVLELCVGSGVNSLFAAARAGSVTGVDLSGRALAFSRFNAALNGQADALALLEGSLFEPVAGRRFDLVLVNPPFEPVPPGTTWFLHSAGGEDGLDVVRALLADLPAHLEPEGRFEMITWTPGSDRGPEIVPLLREALPDHRLRVDLLVEDPIADVLERFEAEPGYGAWRERLAARGLDRIQMVFVRACRDESPEVEIREPAEEIAACHEIADEWL